MTKFLVPPFTMLSAWFLVFLCVHAGRSAYLAARPLLALTLLTSLVSCSYVALRLRDRRAEPQVRQAYLLNVVALGACFVLLLVFAVGSFLG